MIHGSDLGSATDRQLIAAVGDGDRSALGILFRRHYEAVHLTCYRMIGDSSAADDLAQECFVRILKYADGFEGRAAFTTWLFRIVRNVCLDHLHSESRREERVARAASENRVGREEPVETDPRLIKLREALYSLPADKREVLVLSRYRGYSYAEIAEICETTTGAIKVRAHRAMRELRRRLEALEKAT